MKYEGIYVPVITPVNDKEDVDESSYRKLINNCIEGGVHGILAAGSNGDCLALTQKQRNNALRIAVDECSSRVPVIGGVMDSSTRRVIDNIKELEQYGGKAAIITPIFYARNSSPSVTIRMFEEVSRNTTVDLLIYNIPIFTGCLLKPQTIFELSKIDKVVGYKDSTTVFDDFLTCLEHYSGSEFGLFQGVTSHMVASLLLGGRGCTPALAAIFPKIFVELYSACLRQEMDEISTLNASMRHAQELLSIGKNPTAAVKYAASLQMNSNKKVLSPQDSLSREEEILVENKYYEIADLVSDI